MLWDFTPSIAVSERLQELEDRDPCAFAWLNRSEYAAYAVARTHARFSGLPIGQIEGVDLAGAPTPRLYSTSEDFAPDLFFLGELFVSSQLLEILALDHSEAQLLPVDCSACSPAMRSKEYKVLNLLAYANPMDRERSRPAIYTDIKRADGTSTFVWSTPGWQPGMPIPHLFWREDFVAPAPLFRVPGRFWDLATDALAERVLRAGFDDVMFHDLTNDGSRTHGLIVRALDGTRTIG